MHPHVVRAEHLSPEGESFALQFTAAEATDLLRRGGLPEDLASQALTAQVRVVPGGADVFVLGTLQGTVTGPCSRCLEPGAVPLAGEFHLIYVRQPDAEVGSELELRQEDLDLEVLPAEGIDLEAVLAEQVLLLLPPHPVCSAGCRGLCPVCGCNRNREACTCGDAKVASPFAVLAGLRGHDAKE